MTVGGRRRQLPLRGRSPEAAALPLFDGRIPPPPPARIVEPAWWYGSGTPTQNAHVLRGLHPLGLPLGPEGTTCGACAHLFRRVRVRAWWKCDLRPTRGAATDVRRRWRGCAEWAARPAGEDARTFFAAD